MLIAVGGDDPGAPLMDVVKSYLGARGIRFVDYSRSERDGVDYPEVAEAVARAVADGACDLGILTCGTGVGMSISANKVPGIRAALCHDTYSAERARASNDAQILVMGARVIGLELGRKIVETWLAAERVEAPSRSVRKLQKLNALDDRYRKID